MALVERLAILIDANSQGAVREFRKLSGEAAATDKQLTKSQAVTQKAGAAFKVLGAAAGAAAVAGISRFADASIDAASALEEARSKATVVFGDQFSQIQRFAEVTANSLNISERAAFQYTATLGQLFQAAGLSDTQTAKFSETLTTLAADLASFNDISVDEAFQKLQSGLSGEAEPLRRVGVFLSAAKVEAEAYESGIAEVGSALTEGQKIQARYNIILRETANAQGDVERTSGSLANRQRDLAESTEDLQATLGESLAPIKADFLGIAASFADLAGEADDAFKSVGDGSTGLADVLVKGPLWRAFENIRNAWSDTGDATAEATGPIRDYTSAAQNLLEKMDPLESATEDVVKPTNDLGKGFGSLYENADDAAGAIRVLTDAVDQMRSPVLDVRDANRDFADSIDAYHEVMQDGESTQREQAEALDAIADAAFGVLDANARAGASTGELEAKTSKLRGELVKAKGRYDNSASAAQNYADKIGLIPGNVTTNVRLAGIDAAIAQAQRLKDVTTGLSVGQLTSVVRQDEAMANRRRASGGPVGPGTYLVGERGPELLSLGAGRGVVQSAARTKPILNNSGLGNVTVNVVAPDPMRAHESVLNALAEQAYRQGVVR